MIKLKERWTKYNKSYCCELEFADAKIRLRLRNNTENEDVINFLYCRDTEDIMLLYDLGQKLIEVCGLRSGVYNGIDYIHYLNPKYL